MIFILSGCRSTKNQVVKFEKKDKAPSALEDISKDLQDILKDVEKIESVLDGTDMEVEKAEMEKVKEEEKAKQTIEVKTEGGGAAGDQGGGQGGGGTSGGQSGSSSGGGGSSGGSQGGQEKKKKPEGKDEKLLDTWEKIDKKIEDTHNKWNEYEAEGLKKGISLEKAEKFKNSLNSLTKSIENRRILGIYDYGSQSMGNLAPMFELYKDEVWGEINKLKNYTYQAYIRAIQGKEKEASKVLDSSEEEINKIRLKLGKDEGKIKVLDNVRLSIEDMKKALNEKSLKLTRIKKDIIIKNLEEVGK